MLTMRLCCGRVPVFIRRGASCISMALNSKGSFLSQLQHLQWVLGFSRAALFQPVPMDSGCFHLWLQDSNPRFPGQLGKGREHLKVVEGLPSASLWTRHFCSWSTDPSAWGMVSPMCPRRGKHDIGEHLGDVKEYTSTGFELNYEWAGESVKNLENVPESMKYLLFYIFSR